MGEKCGGLFTPNKVIQVDTPLHRLQNFDHSRKEHQKHFSCFGNKKWKKKKCYNYLKIKNKCYHGAGRAGGSLDEGPGLSGQPGQGRAGGGADGAAPALDIRNLCGNEDRLMLG